MLRRTVRGRLSFGGRVSASLRYHRPPRRGVAAGPTSWLAGARARAEEFGVTPRRRGGHRRAAPRRAR